MVVRTMGKLYLVFYFLLWISIAFCISDLDDIQNACKARCQSNLIQAVGGNLLCDDSCWVIQCQNGCTKLSSALSSTCQRACTPSSTQKKKEAEVRMQKQNCIQGCSLAMDIYATKIKGQLEPLLKPDLIRETKNYSSIVLQWNGKILPEVTYMIQIRMLDIHQISSDWQIHNDSQFLTNGKIAIFNLHPYVTYRFKVLAVITPLPQHVAESPETVPITTLPHGVPASAPQITSISAPSPSVISISWTPPQFSNGPLVGYRINVNPKKHPTLKPSTKDLLGSATSWTVGQLQPSQHYVITVSAWNAAGEGPADSSTITTPNPGNLSIHETPYLILGAANKVLKQNLMDLIHSVPDTIHDEHNRSIMVTGVGIHIRRQMLLVSDTSGKVTLISITGDYRKDNLYPSLLKPTAISIDWLTDWVYIASGNKIYRCFINSDSCITVVDALQGTPGEVKVDPVNGFLYFTQYGEDKGLYQIDLGDIGKSGPVRPTQLVYIDNLLSFVIDFDNVRLYYPNSTENTMMSVFVDGTDSKDIREKVFQPNFYHVLSIANYKGLFYWTNGTKVLSEEFDPGFKKYRHNELLFFNNYYRGFNLYHPSAQPTPVPHMSPKRVQAVFTSHSVKVKWQPPPLLQYQGCGAWQNWTYELQLYETEQPGPTFQLLNSTVLRMTIANLLPDTRYSLRVRALSVAGYGPWSEYFIGRTLKDDKIPVRVLMATSGQIIESDISLNVDKTVVNFVSKATDISWHKDKLLWTSSSGILSVYDRSTGWRYSIQHVNYAACVAYDWLGKKIFWSEPQQGVIKRTDINGLSTDFISQAAARDIVVDSIAGRIYWATMNSIESSFLNGEDHIEIFSVPYFSGKHVISVALNFDMKKVLWYVKSFEHQDLFMADLISGEGTNTGDVIATVRPAGDFRSISKWSGLQYYSHRLFWMDQASALVVGNMECNYTSVISPRNISVTAFAVMHPSMHGYPAGLNENSLQVIPKPMKPSSVQVSGPWSSFNLTWKQSSEVNHGKVFYKVYVQIAQHSTHIVTSKTWHPIEGLSPYTLMSVSIQPYTYWGYANPTRVSIRSPMSVPTQPRTPRVYVTQRKNATTSKLLLAADFRWSTPIIISGILSHHIVYHWIEGHERSPQQVQVSGISRHFILNNLIANKTYYFQVRACTEVGCGPKSDVVSAVTDAVNPVPRLLIATKSSVRLSEMDGHLNSTVILPSISPSAMAFLAQDERTFWIEQTSALYVSQGARQISLQDLNGTGKDLSMDWISRTLYTVEEESMTKSRIMGYHIDQDTYEEILLRSKPVGSIVTDPYTSSLFWTEKDSKGQGHIFHSSTTGSDIIDLIGGQRLEGSRKKRADPRCNCAHQVNVSPVIAMDYSAKGDTNILFSDEDSYSIMASDGMGCRCRVLFSATPGDSQGLPPSLLAVDHLRVYWYNKSEQKLYSVNKNTGGDLLTQTIPDVQDIVAYGAHLQPLPDSACLDPGPYNFSVVSESISNVSITLRLNEMKRPSHCSGISLPQDKYTVYYTKQPRTSHVGEHIDCSIEANNCTTLETYERTITVGNLEPFTDYVLQVAVSNYYTEYLAEALGPPTIYRTQEGVPSPSQNVTAIVLKPVEIQVEWFAPANPRGPLENITYVVKWSTLTSAGVYLEGQTDRSAVRQMRRSGKFYTYLKSLQPKHTYMIKILSFDSSKTLYSESRAVRARTFDNPGELTLLQSFPDSLRLRWTSPSDNSVTRHSYQYAEVTSGELLWMLHDDIPQSTENNTDYEVDFTELKPNTDYVFQVKALYQSTKFSLYVWPNDRRYTFKTMTDVPDQPFPPKFHQLKSGTHEVVWSEPDDNGAAITHYLLEYSFPDANEWRPAFNGSSLRWLVDDETLQPRHRYIFRVVAENTNGWSPYSDNSSVFLAPSALIKSAVTEEVGIAIAVSISFLIIVIIIVITGICICTKRRQHEKKKAREFIAVYQVPDMELATLRELPRTAVQQSNTLYGISYVPTAEDIASLPHFRRDQLNLTKFLGSGAFGEVFMGVAKNILHCSSGETKVAVKTLRKSATKSEKEEFLKEALLMSNFHHEHILGLLGVCLDNDPQFLILELMEGSDLLSFLRNCRATSTSQCKLLLPDLVQICVHVARGCQYLEEMHFVHRDLAARNCLVSSVHPVDMVIKIGDFGLARDIYKNDYYRKEGEGLLPVRWMSPESLVDGVFTTLSDIWAFGVLMWEVVTLGQQPYPARTNIEVLHFVRAGGKLERPEKCPDEIYDLMQKCWSFSPEDRPTFSYLLQKLEQYKEICDNMSPDEIAQSSPTALDAQPPALQSCSSTTTMNTDFYYGLANLAFDDEVVASDSSEDEDAGPTAMSTRSSCPHHRREGGSVRLTPTSKKRRLMTLLGGAEASEKLTVDLPNPMKRTISLDSKHSSASDDPRISYSQVQFIPEREYDEMGYLKPRKKDIPKYLELINDPDTGGMQPVSRRLASPSDSVTSINSRRSSQYAAMNKHSGPSSPSSVNFPLIQFNDSNGNSNYNRAVRNIPDKPPPYQIAKELALRSKSSGRSCKNDASHMDRDLYSRPLISGQLSSSSSESGYYCVECYNNRSPPNRCDNKTVPNYERVDEGRMESPLPNYSVWSNNNIGPGCSGEVSNANKDLLVFPPEYVNVANPGSGGSNHGGGRTSRNQVYPENGAAFAGFEISQASLV